MDRFAVLTLWFGLVACAHAEDWPEFRGPTGQGHSTTTGLPAEWGPTRNITWKVEVPGSGWSSPVVSRGKIYLTSAVAKTRDPGLSLQVLCLDAKTGKSVWAQEVLEEPSNAPRIHRKNSHASPTPLLAGDRLYAHFGHQGIVCLDLNGKILWKNTSVKYAPVHGNGGTPILVDDVLIFSCDGGDKAFVVALDAATGKVRWKTDRPFKQAKMFCFSTPLLISVNGKKQVVSPGPGLVAAYDPTDGKEIWHVRYNGYSVIPRPVYGNGLVYVSSGYDSPVLYAIRPEGTGDVTKTHVAWTTNKAVSHTPSFLLHGEELYLVSDRGVASCLDAKTGKVHWTERLNGNFSASPLLADGKIYFQDEDGTATVIKPGKTFQQLARNALDERTLASYAIADGAIFLRSDKHLYRIESK